LVSETLSVVSVDWFGLDTAWRLKLAHAARHIDQLAKVCNAYRAQDPQHVDPEPTDQPGRTAYRLYVDVPIPVDISLIAGDVLHNLRSALNTLAFALVVNDIDRELTADEGSNADSRSAVTRSRSRTSSKRTGTGGRA
jgi:hypothetical protein